MIKIIKNTGFLLLIMAFLATLAIFISGFCGIHKYLVVSGSMEPSLYAGDLVFVNSNVTFEDVQLGDVVIFQYGNMNVIHRVVEEALINGKRHLKTKGDNNKQADGYLTTEENYCGVAMYHIPKIGFLIDYKNSIER